jgi:hypothetical protein
MFQAVPPPIIRRSNSIYSIGYFVKPLLLPVTLMDEMERCILLVALDNTFAMHGPMKVKYDYDLLLARQNYDLSHTKLR